jgi:hypothetical protein
VRQALRATLLVALACLFQERASRAEEPPYQPALVRRPDALRRYDVWLPMADAAHGYWLRVGLCGPYWDNPDPALCRGWNCLPIQSLTVGVVRPGRISTTLNGRLVEVQGVWADCTSLGFCSGLLARATSTLNSRVACTVPAGHDHVSVLFRQIIPPWGGRFTTQLDGDVIDSDCDTSYLGASANSRVSERVLSIAPSDSDRTLQVTLTTAAGRVLELCAVQSWSSVGTADPRAVDPADGLWLGNRLIESYTNCYAGLSVTYPHTPNTFTDCYRLCTPNTVDMVIGQDNGSGVGRFTAYGFHYSDSDYPFTVTSPPTSSVDGGASCILAAAPTDEGAMQYGAVRVGDTITIACSGTCGAGGATSVTFGQEFTAHGVSLPSSVSFTNSAAAPVVYLPTLSGADRSTTLGLPQLAFDVTIPPAPDVYTLPPLTTFQLPAASVDVAIHGNPWVVQLTGSAASYFLASAGASKVYIKQAGFETPASGVTWHLSGSISVRTAATYSIEADAVGQGSVDFNPPGGTYLSGTSVQIMAHAAPGWQFDHWSGDLTGSTNPISVVMDGNKSILATFTQYPYDLSVYAVGRGSVAVSFPSGSPPPGTLAELTARPAPGWRFDHWLGDVSGNANPVDFALNNNMSVTAFFSLIGDLNNDNSVDFGDINSFVLALADPAAYASACPECLIGNADINSDNTVDFRDINPFVNLLTGNITP